MVNMNRRRFAVAARCFTEAPDAYTTNIPPPKTKAPAASRRQCQWSGEHGAGDWPTDWLTAALAAVVSRRLTSRAADSSLYSRLRSSQHEDPGTECSAGLPNHRNYFQRQPEHVEDESMHHTRKKWNHIHSTSSRFQRRWLFTWTLIIIIKIIIVIIIITINVVWKVMVFSNYYIFMLFIIVYTY